MANLLGNLGSSIENILGAKANTGLNYNPSFPILDESVNQDQIGTAYGASQDALARQLAFVNALNPQQAIQQQQDLANQYQQQALGQGPNPAQAALNQATGTNVANQSALMAGQRGSGANAGLIARQAAMQGAGIQQQAAGQSATMQAQQQLAAQQALANLTGSQISGAQQGIGLYNQAAQSQQQLLLNAIAQANQQKVAMQSNINNVAGGLANTVANGQGNVLSGIAQAGGSFLQGIGSGLFKGGGPKGGGGGGGGGGASEGDISNANGQNQSDVLLSARGGLIQNYDAGGVVDSTADSSGIGPQSFVGKYLKGWGGSNINTAANPQGFGPNGSFGSGSFSGTGDNIYGPKRTSKGEMAANVGLNGYGPFGGLNGVLDAEAGFGSKPVTVAGGPTDPSGAPPIQIFLPVTSGPTDPGNDPQGFGGFGGGGRFAAKGGVINGEKYANQMKPVPGKASVDGDSLKNDKVKAMLSPGEIIIPRSIAQHPNAPQKAAEFVAAILAKNGNMRGKK